MQSFFYNKIEGIRASIKHENFKAMAIFRKNFKRVETDTEFKPAKVSEVSKIIKGIKNSNSLGDSE